MNLRARFLEYALTKLTERQRECIELVEVGGLSYHQAAEVLGINGGSVHKAVKAARKKLRRAFEEDDIAQILFA